jgi:hypothetical protein
MDNLDISALAATRIRDLLDRHPKSRAVLFEHFGGSCFECPAASEETVDQGIRVHRTDNDAFYADLLKAIRDSPSDLD